MAVIFCRKCGGKLKCHCSKRRKAPIVAAFVPPLIVKKTTIVRVCLKCDKGFASTGPGNRICSSCANHSGRSMAMPRQPSESDLTIGAGVYRN